MCHTNKEDISRAKNEYLSKLLLNNDIDVVLIQETHATTMEDLRKRDMINGNDLLGATCQNVYDVCTYVRNNIQHARFISTNTDNAIDLVSIQMEWTTLNNVQTTKCVVTTGCPSNYCLFVDIYWR